MNRAQQPCYTPVAPLPPGHGEALALLGLIDRALWIYDFDKTRIVWANAQGLAFWQAHSVAELAARDFNPVGQGTAERLGNLRVALGAGGGTRHENWTYFPGGEPCSRECRISAVSLEDGRLAMLVDAGTGTFERSALPPDFTYELRAIAAVRQSPLMISLCTHEGQWLMHNPAAEALVNRLSLINLPGFDNFLAMFAHPAEAAALRSKALQKGSAHGIQQMAGNTLRLHQITLRRLNDPVTGRLSLLLSQQDVTRAQRLERRLKKALVREKAMVETQRLFLSITSHDFRTPLTIIDGAARRIGRMAGSDSAIAARADAIRATATRMAQAVDRTLGWSSIAEGKVAFHPELLDIGPLLEKAVASQRTLHPDRAFVIELGDVPSLLLDAGLVERSLDNLLSNALKYSPQGASVDVRCIRRGKRVELSVTDHGIGVPAADMRRLFTRFFRSANTKGTKGTGIGLNAVKFYMGLHGGKVAVRSVEGEGSTFTLVFPIR
ncbi:hypothetical protein IP81_13810 [Novosphingobium sp. AAP83]|uniref:sensor histidine kinase n=1 Tax=Novosphingobium sp. AAP83 TaxID=1523425 RepID=UPI0006B930BA|nr:HAMP domain-containing sensor histidine kinase [Novosphingobium sp. AAP83]KPF90743.1 hypothetical protein IP81_13810 [Novosphingobium sp. AAP83]